MRRPASILLLIVCAGLGVALTWGVRRALQKTPPAPVAAAPSTAPADPAPRRIPPRPAPPRTDAGAGLRFHPRAAGEWDGMPVRVDDHPQECETSAQCGLALACVKGTCGPCQGDGDCLSGERCVLDHCVTQANFGCRSRHDCKPDELCVLSGYSPDPRNNASMTSACLAPRGGREVEPLAPADTPKEYGDYEPPSELLKRLERQK